MLEKTQIQGLVRGSILAAVAFIVTFAALGPSQGAEVAAWGGLAAAGAVLSGRFTEALADSRDPVQRQADRVKYGDGTALGDAGGAVVVEIPPAIPPEPPAG